MTISKEAKDKQGKNNMTPIIVTSYEPTSSKKLYWLEDDDRIMPLCNELCAELVWERLYEDYDFAFDLGGTYRHNIHGNCKMKVLLEALIGKANITYLANYTEEELLNEVAADWESLSGYMFGAGLVKVELLKKAYELAQKDEPLVNILDVLMEKPVMKLECEGCSQGEWTTAYVSTDMGGGMGEEEQKYVKALIEAYAFGCYDEVTVFDEDKEPVISAMVTNYVPTSIGTYDNYQDYVKECVMKEMGKTLSDLSGIVKPYKNYELETK